MSLEKLFMKAAVVVIWLVGLLLLIALGVFVICLVCAFFYHFFS